MTQAALIEPHIHQKIVDLHQVYAKLKPAHQAVLTILSIVYKPIGISKLEQLIGVLHQRGLLPNAKKDYILSVDQRHQLVKKSLMESTPTGLVVSRLLANRLVSECDQVREIIMAAEVIVPALNSYSWHNKELDKKRVIRDLYFLGHIGQVEDALAFNKNPQIIDHVHNAALVEILFFPFNLAHFVSLPNTIQYQAFATLLRTFQTQGLCVEYPIQLLEQVCAASLQAANLDAGDSKAGHLDTVRLDAVDLKAQKSTYNINCHHLLSEQYLYQMRFDDFQGMQIANDNSAYGLQLQGAYCFLTGENKQALSYFEQALAARNKIARRKKQYLPEVLGYFYKLALMVEANQHDVSYFAIALQQAEFEESDTKASSAFYTVGRSVIRPILSLSQGTKYNIHIEYSSADEEVDYFCHQLNYFNYLLSLIWCNQSSGESMVNLAAKYRAKFEQLGYPLFATLCEQMIMRVSRNQPVTSGKLVDITALIKVKSTWDIALDKLIALNPNAETTSTANAEAVAKPVRLIWELMHDYNSYSLTAREQKLNKSGWSKGRTISLKRLKEETRLFDYLSDHDKSICRAIASHQSWGYYSKLEYSLEGISALNAAVGAENLYKEGDLSQPIELVKREPELLVSQQGDQLCLSIADLSHDIEDGYDVETDEYEFDQDSAIQGPDGQISAAAFKLKPVSEYVYHLTLFSPDHIKVAKIIGEGGLLIPISAKQKALDGISAIAPFLNIQSDIAELDTGLETHVCDPNLVINIQPIQYGLSFTCVVMPFGENGPALKPAVGNASLTTDIAGKRIATQRDLVREETLLDKLDLACPAFLDMPDNVLSIDDLQSSLGALEQLESAIADANFDLILRWPKGKKVSLSKTLESKHLQLAVNKNSEWFDITGDLQVNNEQVIELRKLLELVRTSNGRFIELGTDQILSLSDDLRQKLEHINQVSDDGKFHPLASFQIEEATAGMRMKTIHAWDQQTKKMHEANAIEPQIPSTFQAQLRDYQLVGFDWASRLAHWGAGACLADDMGLGKTLQALAVLLDRASAGPSLVIAPTSVCFNWQQEALKFAPTLNIKLFADASNTQQRVDLLNDVQPFDCVIISYGLLQRESAILKEIQWHTIVADEAQAIKNPLTKRTKAAIALKGAFKMITTGTPIENDLTELWSLFRFINPGLLGNLKRFNERFSQPIENAKENKLAARKASQSLKTLIQPFILRRMKNQVLTELPPRTDINIQVEMSAKERDFYEALRLNAIDNISKSGQQANAGEQRIRMLAELVKLRQACCNPKLVMAETDVPSAKLAALGELLEELRLNNHKALIFSQFVGHLQLIKQHLDTHGFNYQYLDGSTPQKERQKRVNAFQSGDGDIFLISLKAGGSGLNLTAADYVIHMDPWWNPAVEEQASDRAHRMGQTRPVTIYRLIAKNTIEEKIVAMHQHKRDLADKLLAGNEAATKLSVDDMLNLLKDTF